MAITSKRQAKAAVEKKFPGECVEDTSSHWRPINGVLVRVYTCSGAEGQQYVVHSETGEAYTEGAFTAHYPEESVEPFRKTTPQGRRNNIFSW